MADEAFPIAGTNQITDIVGWESFFTSAQLDGIYYGIQPSINSGARTVTITDGAALVRGFYKPVYASRSTTVPTASAQNRIDRLVMRLDRSQAASAANFIKHVIVQGTSGSSTPPALTRVISPTGIWDIPICRWTSASNGTLSGLIDERYWLGGGFTQASRTGALLPAWPPRVGVEVETDKIFRSDGATWTQATEDTGWVNLTMNGPNGSAWTPNTTCRVRRINGVVHLRIAVKRGSTDLTTGDSDGSAPITLPSGYAPGVTEIGFGFHSRSPVAVQVETSGNVRLYPLTADIPAGRTVQATATYFAG